MSSLSGIVGEKDPEGDSQEEGESAEPLWGEVDRDDEERSSASSSTKAGSVTVAAEVRARLALGAGVEIAADEEEGLTLEEEEEEEVAVVFLTGCATVKLSEMSSEIVLFLRRYLAGLATGLLEEGEGEVEVDLGEAVELLGLG